MFESRLVDRFSRTHWSVVPILYVPAVSLCVIYGLAHHGLSVAMSAALFATGVLLWTLSEYVLHRWFFHWVPPGRWGERMHFLVHGVHHRWPRDRYRLVMPPAVSIALFWGFLGLFILAVGPRAWPLHAGFTAGYVFYDVMHYAIHHLPPRWGWHKALRQHHLAHHAPRLQHERKFGVSNTIWDHVFGTY